MKQQAKIYILSGQKEKNDYSAVLDGTVEYVNDSIQIEYAEEGVSTFFVISKDIIALHRLSDPQYSFTFQKDVPYASEIKTDYGNIPVTVKPVTIRKAIEAQEIYIQLTYSLSFSNDISLFNHVSIKCILQ